MPTILRLRYLGQAPALVPVLGRQVDVDELVDVPGRHVTEAEAGCPVPDDAYLIATGNPPEVRAWPHSMWRDETTAVAAKKPKE